MGKEMEVIKDIEEDVKRIKGDLRKINPDIKEIETKIEVLSENIKENIKEKDKCQLEENEMAIYMFYYIEGSKFLKIGKANKRTKQRFETQHYSINGAPSTFAKSLYFDIENYKNSSLSKIIKIEKIKKSARIVNNELSSEEQNNLKNDDEIIKDWINKECLRINIKIDTKGEKLDEFILEYFEAYFHVKYNPKYEGK